jgi:hypothetical protein
MDRAADVNAALAFVINRIEEQAMRLGQPLDEEQRWLLNNLPDQSDMPEFSTGDPEFPVHFKLRDVTYEKLCAVAKAAYRSDREMNPGSQEWEFAFNVSKTQPSSYGLAFAVGWCETAQALVGQMAFGRCFATFRHSYYSPDARRYRPREGFVAMGNCWCWIHRPPAFHALCFPANRTTSVGAKHREMQGCLSRCWHPYVTRLA